MMGDMNCGRSGLTTPLTIYGFGLRGNSVYKSTRKHRFRTQKPRKALQSKEKIGILAFGSTMSQVRILSFRPNKVDSFDTRVSETINLFLFAKMLVPQGFSRFLFFELVSLRMNKHLFSGCGRPEQSQIANHAETIPRRKVSAWLYWFHCDRKSFSVLTSTNWNLLIIFIFFAFIQPD